jgi:hypothetical protein
MAKFLLKHKKKCFYKEIKKFLKNNNACYVLLTCSDPAKDGNMQVDMAYDGDEVLASYLLENAILVLQEKDFGRK